MPTNTAYSYTGTGIYWQYRAIANTYIYAGTLGGMSHTPTIPFAVYGPPYNTYPYVFSRWYNGIFNGTFTNWEANTNYLNQGGAYGPNPFGPTWNAASGVTHAFCLTAPGPRCDRENTPPSDSNALILGLTAQNDLNTTDINTSGSRASVTMAWSNTYLNDRYAPSIPKPPDKDWSDDSAALDHPLNVNVLDAGLGAYNLNLQGYGAGSTQVARYASCTGDPQRAPCPLSWPTSLSYRLDEGVNTLTMTPTDIVDNVGAAQTWTEKIDRTGPDLALAGSLWADRATRTFTDGAELVVTATDGSVSAVQTQRSGVRTIQVFVDDDEQGQAPVQGCARPEGSCSAERTFIFDTADFGPGSHRVRIKATDQVGKESSTSWDVQVGPADPTEKSSYDDDETTLDSYGTVDDQSATCSTDAEAADTGQYCNSDDMTNTATKRARRSRLWASRVD